MKSDNKKAVQQIKNTLELLRENNGEASHARWPAGIFTPRKRSFSGEMMRGEELEMSAVFAEKVEENRQLKARLAEVEQIKEEEQALIVRKSNELKIRIKSIQEELLRTSKRSSVMAEQTNITALLVDVDPTIYNLFFLDKIFELIRNFTKRLQDANVWLLEQNKRAAKKARNKWGQNYKKQGAKYLLSGEHYLSRSAG